MREDKRAYKGLGCLSGEKVSYGTYMPDLTHVAYVLRHAEI